MPMELYNSFKSNLKHKHHQYYHLGKYFKPNNKTQKAIIIIDNFLPKLSKELTVMEFSFQVVFNN